MRLLEPVSCRVRFSHGHSLRVNVRQPSMPHGIGRLRAAPMCERRLPKRHFRIAPSTWRETFRRAASLLALQRSFVPVAPTRTDRSTAQTQA